MYKGKYYREDAPKPKRPKSKKKAPLGTIIFYLIYLLVIVGFFAGVQQLLIPLEDWLVKYEASQPEKKCEEVFQALFHDPDWSEIYNLSKLEDTKFEGSEAYESYMKALCAGKKLTYVETSAGLSGDHKYIVKLEDEKIATFTLTGGADSQTDIPVWELGSVELFFTRRESVIVSKVPGCTVYINSVPLDDSYTIRSVSTVAEQYLPEGLHGYRMEQQMVTGLLVAPDVVVADENGNTVPMIQNPQTGVYEPVLQDMEMTDDERSQAENALIVFAKYMVKKAKLNELQAVCDPNSDVYSTISGIERWMQSFQSYELSPVEFTQFYRYSDNLFSVRATLTNKVTRFDGTVKDYEMDYTWFFSQDAAGKWLMHDMTQVDTTEIHEQVRLTFVNGETLLDSFFVKTDSRTLTLPTVTVPEGKVFGGWVLQEDDGNGKITLTVVFTPDEAGNVTVYADQLKDPMTLYALFKDEGKGS